MRLISCDKTERVFTITLEKSINESAQMIESKLRIRFPELQNKILKSWIDVTDTEQVYIFVESANKPKKRPQLLLD